MHGDTWEEKKQRTLIIHTFNTKRGIKNLQL